jgi:Fuc2NAc and GlcNAc transferase
MIAPTILIAVTAFATSWLITRKVRAIASAKGMLDHPNERSSHSIPTPRGGGLGIVVSVSLGCFLLWTVHAIDRDLSLALIVGGLAVATVGFLDDRYSLSVRYRLIVQLAAAMWAMFIMGDLPAFQLGDRVIDPGVFGYVLGTVAIVWTSNLFNFMDGIDGLAGSEAAFITLAGAVIGAQGSMFIGVSAAALVVCAASVGFLIWNWPPAKIFMGDVGSGYLGYVIAVLALGAAKASVLASIVWLILGGVFFVDATVTLSRRLMRRQKVYAAHRSHAYQWMARRWRSHKRVTLLLWAINIGWLLPIASLCVAYPARTIFFVGLALTPLIPLVLISGAGRAESKDE